jgi:hypothetical protein
MAPDDAGLHARCGPGQDGKPWHFKAEAFYHVQKDGLIAGH